MRPFFLPAVLCLVACAEPPAMVRAQKKLGLVAAMQRDLLAAMEAEKSAVLTSSDPESVAFADEAKKANGAVEQGRVELRRLVELDGRQTEVAALQSFEEAWRGLVAIDERLLALAVANTNVKAARLASGEAATAVNQLVDALTQIEAATAQPALLRELSSASVAALRIQALLAPHIASSDDASMSRLEEQLNDLGKIVDKALAGARAGPASTQARAAEAFEAWARYQRLQAEIIRLSRLNTNVLSQDLSVHEKREAMITAQNALAALLTAIRDAPRATR